MKEMEGIWKSGQGGDESLSEMDHRLIFLCSQPRAGSTMLQMILSRHQEIHTTSEPWLMLHPIYALRQRSIGAPYEAALSYAALQNFLKTVPGQEVAYYKALGYFGSYLFQQALTGTGKKYFLDKTPRYYLVIPELARVFPRAKFIILLRNPLAVLVSIIRTWVRSRLDHLSRYKNDLFSAPELLLSGINHLGDRCSVVNFEAFVKQPEDELKKLLVRLGLKPSADLVNYAHGNGTKWEFGDQDLVYKSNRPLAENADRWLDDASKPQIWRLLNDYLDRLGPETMRRLGYDYEQLSALLAERRPNFLFLIRTISLTNLVDRPLRKRQAKRYGVSLEAA